MNQTVIGVFDDPAEAQNAVQQLLMHGFARTDIDISIREADQDDERLSNFFTSLFGRDESKSYTDVARESGAIVTVYADSQERAMQAANILDEAGALDMDERACQYQAGVSEQERLTAAQKGSMAETAQGENVIPIIEEQMKVGKQEIETGRVKLRSRIIERPVEESLRLREEHVHIERQPVNRPATEAELASFKEGEVEITERAEVPIINKEARVVEEVKVEKQVEEREEVVREKLRKTQVDVESGKRPR